jgi:hypothetical protein
LAPGGFPEVKGAMEFGKAEGAGAANVLDPAVEMRRVVDRL